MDPKLDELWHRIELAWSEINIYDGPEIFLGTYQAAGPLVGFMHATTFAYDEIFNGGFHQLFSNSTGVLVPEAIDGFRLIGMPETSEIVSTALKLFGEAYPRERGDRQKLLAGIERSMLSDLDGRFYDLMDVEAGGFLHASDVFISCTSLPLPQSS